MGTVGQLPDFHCVHLQSVCHPPAMRHCQGREVKWRPHGARILAVRKSRIHPGKLRRRALVTRYRQMPTGRPGAGFPLVHQWDHMYRVGSVGRRGDRGARGAGDEKSRQASGWPAAPGGWVGVRHPPGAAAAGRIIRPERGVLVRAMVCLRPATLRRSP